MAIGASVAVALVVTDLRCRRLIGFLYVLSMMIAPQVVALAFLTLAGPASPLLNALGLAPPPGSDNPMLGRSGVIAVLALHHAPLVTVTLVAGLRALPLSLIEAAQLEGATPARILALIVLPLLRPQLLAAALLAFVAGVGNFGIPAMLGMPVGYNTLTTLIYQRLASFGPAIISDAAALSVLVGLIAGLGVIGSGLARRRSATRLEAERGLDRFWPLGRARPLVEAALWLLVGLVLVLPLTALLAAALVPSYGVPLSLSTVTADNFIEVLVRQDMTVRAFRNSFLLAGGAALLLATAAVPIAWALDRRAGRGRGPIEAVIEMPFALPGIVVAIACILIFARPLPVIGISLYATPWIILFAYCASFLPLALKGPLAAVEQLDPATEEAAALDGAGLAQRLRLIVLPMLRPAAAAGGLLVFLTAFNELTISSLLWSTGTETLGVALFNLEEAGLASQAATVAVAASLVVALVMAAADRLAGRLPAGVLPWRL